MHNLQRSSVLALVLSCARVAGAQPEPEDSVARCAPGAQASACHQFATAMIDPTNPHRSPGGAYALFTLACSQGSAASCKVLEARFTSPRPLQPVASQVSRATSPDAASRQSVIRCALQRGGRLTNCIVLRSLGARDTALLKSCEAALYAPGRLDGVPFESTVFLRFDAKPL
jgi:hypothetical protein